MEESFSESDDHVKLVEQEDKTQKSKEMLMHRDTVLAELADTEKHYVDNLETVIKKIIPVFRVVFKMTDIPKKLKKAATSLFGNVEEIHAFHKHVFLNEMESCRKDPSHLGSSFVDHEETLLRIYSSYCYNKPKSDDLMKDYETVINEVYEQYCSKQDKTFLHFLLMPVQRLTKYQLWLQSIIKYTSRAGEDISQIEPALTVMEVVPKVANDKTNAGMIIDYKGDLIQPKVILQNSFVVSNTRRSRKSTSKPREMRVFLFEEFLLMTEVVKRHGRAPQYKSVFEGKTNRMGVTDNVENDEFKFAILFRKYRSSDIYVCAAESIELKQNWIRVLRELVSLHESKRSSFRFPTSSRFFSVESHLDQVTTTPRFLSVGSHLALDRHESAPDSKWVTERMPMRDRAKTWEVVKRATTAHPRDKIMSDKLKHNIQKYLVEEYTQGDDEVFTDWI